MSKPIDLLHKLKVKSARLIDHKHCIHCFISYDTRFIPSPGYGCTLLALANDSGTLISTEPCLKTTWKECPLNHLSEENKANRRGKVEKVPEWAKDKTQVPMEVDD